MLSPPHDEIRVLIVDDHEVVRTGIAAMLREEAGIRVVAEASTAEQALAAAARTQPDVVVMDVRLHDRSGIDATRDIRAAHPETRVLMFTSFADDDAVLASVLAGASGYVLKRSRIDDLTKAIRMVSRGESLIDPAVTATVLEHLRKSAHSTRDERLARLTSQEERVLELVAEGNTNHEIGGLMHLSQRTVKNYVSQILEKLEVARRAQAAAYLAERRDRPPR